VNPTATRPLALAAALALLAAAPAHADSIRCAGGIVSAGDSKLDLLAKCGPATLVDRQEVRRARVVSSGTAADAAASALAAASSSGLETWTYDFGPSQFIRLVTLERGRVVRVETAGHGYTSAPSHAPTIRATRCDPSTIDEGDTKLELLATCGDPTMREAWEETRSSALSAAGTSEAVAVTVVVELWTYDFGPNRFIRLYRIEDGRVTAVETGGYGYGR
jgi:hypothetical protein